MEGCTGVRLEQGNIYQESVERAHMIFTNLIRYKTLHKNGQSDLWEWTKSDEVMMWVDVFCRREKLVLVKTGEEIHIMAHPSSAFAIKGDEVKRELNYSSDEKLYLSYASTFRLLAFFYNSDTRRKPTRAFVPLVEWMDAMDEMIERWRALDDEVITRWEEQTGWYFTGVLRAWDQMPPANLEREGVRRGRNTKVDFLFTWATFLQQQGCVYVRDYKVAVTPQMNYMVSHYFGNEERKKEVMKFMFEGEKDGKNNEG